jgi:oxygen-independent coproporphyrinogen III oxidase
MTAFGQDALGLYFSIPFCRSKCTYCNFASGVYPASEHARYVERIIEDMAGAEAWAAKMQVELPREVDTIYFGGGTPVLLAPELFTQVFHKIREHFNLTQTIEITVESAPGQLSDGTLEAMATAGVNRVSLGVQSFIDREASLSGRLHTRAQVLEDLRRLRAFGIMNLNLDLLAGLGEQTLDSWRESVEGLIDSGVPHASVYMLEIDEDSRLGRELIAGGVRYSAGLVPSDDAIAGMYGNAVEMLLEAGLKQYEISNFAQAGTESKHNLRYWQRRPYLGFGLDASSMLRSGDGDVLRATTTDDLDDYLNGDSGHETSWQGPAQQLEEAWFLGLRRNAGVEVLALKAEFGVQAVEPSIAVAHRLADDGLLEIDGGSVRLSQRGRLISNDVFAEFLGINSHQDLESTVSASNAI